MFERTYSWGISTYRVFDVGCSWTEVKEICENLGGNLVSINTAEEQAFIEDVLEEQSKDNYWTGGYRSGNSWNWCDGTAVTYTNWDSWTGSDGTIHAQPDNYTGDEDYIRIASRFIQYNDWLVNAGGWIDTANTADGISSGKAGLHKFGFICEWEAPPDPFVQAHLNFIEENTDAFVSAEDVYVLAETKKLMYEYDSEITTYNGLKSFQNLIGGDMDTDTFNAELTAQAILTDLLCSGETLAAMETASQKAEDAFLIQALDIFLKNASDFKIDGTDLAELTVLCETEDKSSAEYMLKCKEWIYDFVPTAELELLSTCFDVTGKSGESLLLNVGLDAIETSEKYMDYCIAVKGYNASDACLREALRKLLASMFVEYYMVQDGLDAESIRIKLVVDEFQKYYQSVINTSDTKYLEYATSLVDRLATNSITQAVATLSKELLLTAVSVACPTLGAVLKAMDLAFTIGMNVWEILSNVDERALERDMYLNMTVFYDAIVSVMNGDTSGFKANLVANKTLDSAYIYEEGFGFYQRITAMMINHAQQYYVMLYQDINKGKWLNSSDMDMLFLSAGLLGDAYTDKVTGITGTIEQAKRLLAGTVDEQEKDLLTDYLTLAPWTFNNVKKDVLSEILNIQFSLELFADDIASMSCHELVVTSTPVARSDFYVYDVACPVNVTIRNGDTIVAEVTKDVLTIYDETAPISVNLIKEEGDIYASKFVVVPSGYDVEITGYADGTMRFEKAIVENGLLSTLSTITDIPVQNGSVYAEVIENNVTVALTCDMDGDGVIDETLSAAVTENTLDPGDLNSDGEVNASDAAMILVAAAAVGTGADSGLAAVQEDAADIDHDGAFNAVDAAEILCYAAAVGSGYTGTLEEFLAS